MGKREPVGIIRHLAEIVLFTLQMAVYGALRVSAL